MPGLVVRAEQGGAVRGDERHACQLLKAGEGCRAERFAAAGQNDVAAVIALDDLRLYIFAGAVRRGIHMGDEAERGSASQPGVADSQP